MNTNKLKRFAQATRKKLLALVATKLEYVLTTDTVELRERTAQVGALREELGRTSKQQLVEKVAYTWFNRFVALRFMDVNGYQPLDTRVLTPREGRTLPELLDEAKEGHVAEELQVNTQLVFDLLDGRMPSTNPQNEAYRVLLIGACNYLHALLPFLFERINDYTELLLPDDLTSDFSVVHDVRLGMAAEDCQQVEIIGWLYQFYISEKKDEVFASKAKVKKEDIPAATQLFTPRWIVEYMVQNTVGKLWLQNRPNSALREHMPYFIDSASLQSQDFLKLSSPKELTLLDQACGSGHILAYGFELLYRIYEEEGYNPSEIPQLILKHNLYGFEIDERAAQLAGMALMMKARSYQRRFFKKGEAPQPHILCFQDLKLDDKQLTATLSSLNEKFTESLRHDLSHLRQATNLGSLIVPHTGASEVRSLLDQIEGQQQSSQADLFGQYELLQLKSALTQLQMLGEKYACVVDNPPYMGGGNMNAPLSDFVKRKYPDSKADLMACFMESGLAMLQPKGYLGMINQHSWMFLSSYEDFRVKLIDDVHFDTLIHLGPRTFPEIGGEVVQNTAFTFCNTSERLEGSYIRLVDYDKSDLKRSKLLEAVKDNNGNIVHKIQQEYFLKIPGKQIIFWMSESFKKVFSNYKSLNTVSEPRKGITTGDDSQFIRYWHEVGLNKTNFNQGKNDKFNHKWYPAVRGGEFRKWHGNLFAVINWEHDGYEIKNFKDENNKLRSRPQNTSYNFIDGISWNDVSSGSFAARITGSGKIMQAVGPKIFNSFNDKILLGLLNSKVGFEIFKCISPGIKFEVGIVASFPVHNSIKDLNNQEKIIEIVQECIYLSLEEWNTRETSWDFLCSELLRIKGKNNLYIEETVDYFKEYWNNKFLQLHRNEEKINRAFIDIHGLEHELEPTVPLDLITILKSEASPIDGKLVFHADEVIAQFISYAVGCMFGRYSLDVPGLVLANQGETLQDYLQKVEKSEQEVSFLPDADNIIPVLDDEWFEDDIVGRFYEFLKVTFGEANFAKNIAFVEECLGKNIRKYFVKDFYADHVQRYKKRPIYWLFSSPQGSFNVLIYMHRYTPDTVSHILNKYLREYQEKLRTRREHLVLVEVSGSASEKAKASKEKARLDSVLLELQEYERNILFPLATERIAIDLDNGVLVNYNKFGEAVKLVPGLNDAKAKKQVSEFDWVKEAETV